MSSSRRYSVGVVAAVLGAVVLPSTATATPTPRASLDGLRLVGEVTCGFKTVYGEAQAPYMFAPVRLIGEDFAPTGQRLFPYKVTIVSGDEDGLKARHLTPGETYTMPGPEPTDLVTCFFTGEDRELGAYSVQIAGTIRGRGSRSD